MSNNKGYDPAELPDLLPIYYKRLFPYGPYFKWLQYGAVPKNYFTNREFSFTLKDDVYIRYQSFSDQQDLEKEVQKRCPYKIDIGAIFSHRPKEHKTVKSSAFQAQEKELVFDIDMTDYDDVRFCCSGADICEKCWPLMTIAIKIIDAALRDDFGYEHLLWVYSGRRGVHCWVCDEGARKLSQNGRSAIAEYLSVVKGGESQTKKVTLGDVMHPSIRRALSVIEKHFKDYALKEQDILGDEERINTVLALIPDEDFRDLLKDDLNKIGTNSVNRWTILERRVKEVRDKGRYLKSHRVLGEIMLQFCYPRLDVNVSKGVNHLLKSPFCIHPKTGRVCVPLDHEKPEEFDPFKVPTISEICEELNQVEESPDGTKKGKGNELLCDYAWNNIALVKKKKMFDYKKTSLGPTLDTFNRFLMKLENTWKGRLLEQSDLKREF